MGGCEGVPFDEGEFDDFLIVEWEGETTRDTDGW